MSTKEIRREAERVVSAWDDPDAVRPIDQSEPLEVQFARKCLSCIELAGNAIVAEGERDYLKAALVAVYEDEPGMSERTKEKIREIVGSEFEDFQRLLRKHRKLKSLIDATQAGN